MSGSDRNARAAEVVLDPRPRSPRPGRLESVTDPVDPVAGTVQLIQVDSGRGCYIAASDPRGDGVALAL